MLNGLNIRQIAYYVEDIHEAAKRHHALFGSGPFFYFENATFPVKYRGQDVEFTHSAVFGQWGSMQVELLSSQDSGPSILHELYPEGSGRYGMHHVAVIANDYDETIAEAEKGGFPVAQESRIPAMDLDIVMADTVERYGHFLEIYRYVPAIVDFYDMIEDAAKNFDGTNLLREMNL